MTIVCEDNDDFVQCSHSRVSGGEGGLPDCDVVMLVVDVPDKHNVRSRKVSFQK